MPLYYRHRDKSVYFYHNFSEVPSSEQNYVLHVHAHYELLLILQGHGNFIAENSTYELYPGCIALSRPSEAHCIKVDIDKPYERYMIQFSPSVIAKASLHSRLLAPFEKRQMGENNIFYPEEFKSFPPQAIFSAMKVNTSNISIRREAVEAFLPALLWQITEVFAARNRNLTSSTSATLSEKLISYVNDHLYESLSITDLQNVFFISGSHINRLFKQTTGSSVHQYILTKRLMMAREMILNEVPASIAAQSCGWKDYSSFYRAYIRRFGEPPSKTIIY